MTATVYLMRSQQFPRTYGPRLSTHCKAARAVLASTGTRGFTIVAPIKPSCRNVLYLLMVVGRTSADGREKSQYRMNVLGGGREM